MIIVILRVIFGIISGYGFLSVTSAAICGGIRNWVQLRPREFLIPFTCVLRGRKKVRLLRMLLRMRRYAEERRRQYIRHNLRETDSGSHLGEFCKCDFCTQYRSKISEITARNREGYIS